MNEIVTSLEEITSAIIIRLNRMEKDHREVAELLTKAKKLVPPKEWDSYLETHFHFGRRQAYRYIELAKDETGTKLLASTQHRNKVTLSIVRDRNTTVTRESQALVTETSPKVKEFVRKTEEFKKEQDSLFSTKVRFMVDNVNDCLTRDNPWRGLHELLKLDAMQLSQADLSLAVELAQAIGNLESRASEWYDKIIGKFDVKREDGSNTD